LAKAINTELEVLSSRPGNSHAWRRCLPQLKVWLLLAILLGLLANNVIYNRSLASAPLSLKDMPALSLATVRRALVIAPHPDDETVGVGGAIQALLAQGARVKVVFMTNGDGQAAAPLLLRHEIRPRATNYVVTGEQRQAEALAALAVLGVPAEDALFLGYPDRGLAELWARDWIDDCPLQAFYTRATSSPYPLTFNNQATYCGCDVLADLRTILAGYRPDLIFLPHPNDQHLDHSTASSFAQLALVLENANAPDYQPELWAYLVHYGYFPQWRGLYPNSHLLPPVPLAAPGSDWTRLDLDREQIEVKARALAAHASQQWLLRSFLDSFIRRNELFVRIRPVDIAPLAYDDLELLETNVLHGSLLSEPARESGSRLVLPGADLVGLKVGRLGDELWLLAETDGPFLPGLRYRILVKLPDGQTLVFTWPFAGDRLSDTIFMVHLHLSELGDPPVLGFAAEVQQRVTLDRTSWRFLSLPKLLLPDPLDGIEEHNPGTPLADPETPPTDGPVEPPIS
jgi:LmbE family N-acetylglucosaminyl deacetylase